MLLIYSAISYWKEGSKNIALLNFFVAALTLWQAIENARDIRDIKTTTNTIP